MLVLSILLAAVLDKAYINFNDTNYSVNLGQEVIFHARQVATSRYPIDILFLCL